MLLEKGERGLLVGQTGSGKTQNALFQLKNPCNFPVIIFDTKIEPAFENLPEPGDIAELCESLQAFKNVRKLPPDKFPDYILVRPDVDELQDYEILDAYCREAYAGFGACFIYFDELYNWHNAGRPTNGMIGLYTRGRSKGKTVLGATQRPSWISRFCLTESQKFYVHRLTDARDKKTLAEVIPDYQQAQLPKEPYHFHFYEIGNDTVRLFAPVPELKPPKKKKVNPFRNWI